MNKIKGLIIKDLLNLSKYKFSIIVIFIVFILCFIKEPMIIPIMVLAMIGMIGMSTFNYDETSNSNNYLLSLPTSKKQIVLAKYIFLIGLIVLGALLSFIIIYLASYILVHFNYVEEVINYKDLLNPILCGGFSILLVIAIQIPSVYKWGAEKGRIQMFILIIIVIGLVLGLFYLVTKNNINVNYSDIKNFIITWGPYLLGLFLIVIYFISYKLSLKIYLNKEYLGQPHKKYKD